MKHSVSPLELAVALGLLHHEVLEEEDHVVDDLLVLHHQLTGDVDADSSSVQEE